MTGAPAFAWAQWVITHLSLYATRVDAIATRNHALLQNLIQNRFMQGFPLLRGE
jgi:hypothetical protein